MLLPPKRVLFTRLPASRSPLEVEADEPADGSEGEDSGAREHPSAGYLG
jgi:hypothetical protein